MRCLPVEIGVFLVCDRVLLVVIRGFQVVIGVISPENWEFWL